MGAQILLFVLMLLCLVAAGLVLYWVATKFFTDPDMQKFVLLGIGVLLLIIGILGTAQFFGVLDTGYGGPRLSPARN